MNIQELGHVVLYVRNLEQSANFYRDTLGFAEIHRDLHAAAFSSGRTHHELLLLEVGSDAKASKTFGPGLYHVGFKIGDGPEAARIAYKELQTKGVTIVGTADHTVTHSIYIEDPDGNELELYADVSDEWKKNPQAVMTPTKPLHLD